MSTTPYFAFLLGLLYSTVGIGMLLNHDYYLEIIKQWKHNPIILYFGGIIAFMLGFTILSFHSFWEFRLPIFITIVGCLALIKGFCLLVIPNIVREHINFKNLAIIRILALINGILFMSIGIIYS